MIFEMFGWKAPAWPGFCRLRIISVCGGNLLGGASAQIRAPGDQCDGGSLADILVRRGVCAVRTRT